MINPQRLLKSRRVFAPVLLTAVVALAGCSSSGSGTAAPAWAKASAGDKTFSQLWAESVANNSTNTYSLAPLVLVNGRWYVEGSG